MNLQVRLLLISFFVTVILAIGIIPILRKRKVGQIEREDGPKSHLKKQGTPTMGGIIIALGIFIVTIFTYFYFKSEDSFTATHLIPLVAVTIGFGMVGFVDDFKKLILQNTKGLKPSYKMIGLLVISVVYALYLVSGLNLGTETYIPFVKVFIELPVWIYIPFAIFVMLGTTNAINLTDGIDGLSTTISMIIITTLSVIGMINGVMEVAIIGSIIAGCCLGFLMFNLHPAKVFMGDTGSLLLGGAIVGMALYLKMPLILLIIALIPVFETISVMIQVLYFKKTGNRIFKMAPLHHHFELSGWKEGNIVSVFSMITLILCIVGILAV